MNTVFVTGGRGFIGEQLIRRLIEEKNSIIALVRNKRTVSTDLSQHPNIEWIEGDLLDSNVVKYGIKGCNQVYHLAAFAKPWAKDKNTFAQVNIEGTLIILNACQDAQVNDVVITSSAGTFGPQQSEALITESQVPQQWFTEYERTKWESVKCCDKYLEQGMNIRFVSPTRVFGPGTLSTSNAVTKLIGNYAKGKFRFLPGDGSGIGNYAFIDDIVSGHIKAMHKGLTGENYILGGENLSYRDFFKLVANVCGKEYRMFPFPIPLMLAAAKLMEFMGDTLGIEPLITPPFVRKYAHHWGTDLTKSKKQLGYTVTPAKQAISITLNWIQQNEKQH